MIPMQVHYLPWGVLAEARVEAVYASMLIMRIAPSHNEGRDSLQASKCAGTQPPRRRLLLLLILQQ